MGIEASRTCQVRGGSPSFPKIQLSVLTRSYSIGGNTGTVNSFTGLDLSNITGGVLNTATLLEKNNLLCFVFELLKTFLPNSLSPLLKTIEVPVNMVTDILSTS